MKAKETAVEFMIKNIIEDNIVKKSGNEWEEIFEQAKEMEKEQIIKFVVNTVKIGTKKEGVLFFTIEDEILIRNEAEQYYTYTYEQR